MRNMWIWYLAFLGLVVGVESKVIRMPIYPTVNPLDEKEGKIYDGLKNYFIFYYYGNVNIGTPPQPFQLLINTATSYSWLASKQCTNPSCSNRTRKYDSSLSSTYKQDGSPLELQYKLGGIKGFKSVDNFHIQGVEVKGITFVEANNLLKRAKDYEIDGVLGLSFSKLTSKSPFNTILENLFTQGLIEKRVFSMYIKGCLNALEDVGSEIVFGGSVPTHYIPPLNYAPSKENDYWAIILDDVIIGGRSFCGEDRKDCLARFYSGISDIRVPLNIFNKVLNAIGPHQKNTTGCIFDCDIVPKLPTIYFVISGVKYELEPEEYIKKFGDLCIAMIGFSKMWKIGTVFNMKYYTEYDLDNNRIGFARAK